MSLNFVKVFICAWVYELVVGLVVCVVVDYWLLNEFSVEVSSDIVHDLLYYFFI